MLTTTQNGSRYTRLALLYGGQSRRAVFEGSITWATTFAAIRTLPQDRPELLDVVHPHTTSIFSRFGCRVDLKSTRTISNRLASIAISPATRSN